MGEIVKGISGQSDRKADRTDAGGTGGHSDSSGTANTRTGAGTGGTGGTGTVGAGGTGNKTEKEIVPQLVTVDSGVSEEERKRLERNARRRERYAKEKAENGQTVKPRKVKGKKQEQSQFSNEQINSLILSISAIVASRPNCEQWLLSESEADSITKPLLAILAESEALEIVTKNSNQIALAVACISVFAPRILVTVQKIKAEKEKEKVVKDRETKTDIKKPDKPDNRGNAPHGEKPDHGEPFYGLPVG